MPAPGWRRAVSRWSAWLLFEVSCLSRFMFSFLFWFWLLLRFVLVRGFRARLRNPVVCDGISGTRWNRVLLGQGWRRIAVDLGCYGLLCRLRRQLSFQKGWVAMG